MICENCGGDDFDYSGELFDDEVHVGSCYQCRECGHNQHETTEDYDGEPFDDLDDIEDWIELG